MTEFQKFVIAEFGRRKKQMFFRLGFSLVLLVLSVSLFACADLLTALIGIAHNTLMAVGVSQFACSIAFAIMGLQQCRCPQCNHLVETHDKYCFHPTDDACSGVCPHCGIRLV